MRPADPKTKLINIFAEKILRSYTMEIKKAIELRINLVLPYAVLLNHVFVTTECPVMIQIESRNLRKNPITFPGSWLIHSQ